MGSCPGGHDGGEDGQMATPRQPDTMFFRGRHRGERLLDQRSGEQSVVESIEKIERAVDRGRYRGAEQGVQVRQRIACPGLPAIKGKTQAAGKDPFDRQIAEYGQRQPGQAGTEYLQPGQQTITLRCPGSESGQFYGPAALREDPAECETGTHPLTAGGVGHGQDPSLTVTGKEQRPHAVTMQPAFRIQAVLQQVVKTEQTPVRVAAMPGQVQGRDGKSVFPEAIQERPVLDRTEHGPRIKNKAGGARSGPQLDAYLPVSVAQGMILQAREAGHTYKNQAGLKRDPPEKNCGERRLIRRLRQRPCSWRTRSRWRSSCRTRPSRFRGEPGSPRSRCH